MRTLGVGRRPVFFKEAYPKVPNFGQRGNLRQQGPSLGFRV